MHFSLNNFFEFLQYLNLRNLKYLSTTIWNKTNAFNRLNFVGSGVNKNMLDTLNKIKIYTCVYNNTNLSQYHTYKIITSGIIIYVI